MARKEKKYHFIYKTTNILSGKYYIGMHSTNDLEDGYLGSGNRLRLAIRKHGKENFKREILEFCETRDELIKRETEIVNLDEIAKKECMNLVIGGNGFTSEYAIICVIKSNKKQQFLRENDSKWVERYSEKKSEALKKAYNEGRRKIITPDWNGRVHSEETKLKMSEVKKGKYNGENNPSYGTCWITKDGTNKKIKKEELGTFLLQSWEIGRKIKQ